MFFDDSSNEALILNLWMNTTIYKNAKSTYGTPVRHPDSAQVFVECFGTVGQEICSHSEGQDPEYCYSSVFRNHCKLSFSGAELCVWVREIYVPGMNRL